MKELSLTAITQPLEVLVNTFICFVSVSFFMLSCSKGYSVTAYLDTIKVTLVFISKWGYLYLMGEFLKYQRNQNHMTAILGQS